MSFGDGYTTMGSNRNDQHPHLQPLSRQNSWFSLSLHEVESQLGDVGKPLGLMNLNELLRNVWAAEANEFNILDTDSASSASSLQRQASLTLAKAFSGKTVVELWRDIQEGQKRKNAEEITLHSGEETLGQVSLEDFLVKAGLFAEVSPGPVKGESSSLDMDTSARKRDASDVIEKILDRRLKRKIKNRESAARSRARKQAYHNELVGKITCLEEENVKLKKEKELETILPWELSPNTRYQLRRTSSF